MAQRVNRIPAFEIDEPAVKKPEGWISKKISTIQKAMRNEIGRYLGALGVTVLVHTTAISPYLYKKYSAPDVQQVAQAQTGVEKKAILNDPALFAEVPKNQLPVIKELYVRQWQKVKEVQKERSTRIDPQKVEHFQEKYQNRLQNAPEKVTCLEFCEDAERFGMGVDPEEIKRGKEYFQAKMTELAKNFGKIPHPEFIQKIENLTTEKDYEGGSSSVYAYLACKAEGGKKCGNCEARMKFKMMALEYFYPEFRDKIKIQEFDDPHVRVIFEIEGRTFAMESELPEITPENKAGTLIYSVTRFLKKSVNLEVDPVKPEPGRYQTGPWIPFPTDNDGTFKYEVDTYDKRLRRYSFDIRRIYPDYDIVAAQLSGDEGVGLVQAEDWSEEEVERHNVGNRGLFINVYARNGTIDARGLINPTVATIKNINKNQSEIIYGNTGLFSVEALKEIFQAPSSPEFQIKEGHIPDKLLEVMISLKSDNPSAKFSFPRDQFPLEQFAQLAAIKGLLQLEIEKKIFTKEEMEKMLEIFKKDTSVKPSMTVSGDISFQPDAAPLLHALNNYNIGFWLSEGKILDLLILDPTLVASNTIPPFTGFSRHYFIEECPEKLKKYYALQFYHMFYKYYQGETPLNLYVFAPKKYALEDKSFLENENGLSQEDLIWAEILGKKLAAENHE
jgi:hypothetical protein